MDTKDYINIKLYSEGEKVIVLPHLEQVDRDLGCGITQEMEELSGCVFTIKVAHKSPYGAHINYFFSQRLQRLDLEQSYDTTIFAVFGSQMLF